MKRDYNRFHDERMELMQPHKDYMEINCRDLETMERLKTSKECHDRGHHVKEDPDIHALYDVCSTYGLCFGSPCAQWFAQHDITNPVRWVVMNFVIVFVILSLCGCGIGGTAIAPFLKTMMPSLPTVGAHMSSDMINTKQHAQSSSSYYSNPNQQQQQQTSTSLVFTDKKRD